MSSGRGINIPRQSFTPLEKSWTVQMKALWSQVSLWGLLHRQPLCCLSVPASVNQFNMENKNLKLKLVGLNPVTGYCSGEIATFHAGDRGLNPDPLHERYYLL